LKERAEKAVFPRRIVQSSIEHITII